MSTDHSAATARLLVDPDDPVGAVDRRFLGVGVDLAQVAGARFWDPTGGGTDEAAATGGSAPVEPFDFDRPELVGRLRAFGPGYLRLGGTESDQIDYECSRGPRRWPSLLTEAQWDAAMDLAHASGFEVLFTVNATDRRADGSWDPGPARALLGRAAERRDPVAGWALGNEPNYFVVNHGGPAPDQLARDTRVFAELVHELAPGALVLGPAAAYWPTHGEMLPAMEAVLAGAGDQLDVVTWHYYPQQSERCSVHLVRASAERALTDAFLDDVRHHHDTVRHLRDRYAPRAQIWLQETGNAQCGGQPGLSDTVRAGFWWVNELGRVARDGSSAVVRWNLSGASYGLLAEPDLAPNPDWWLGVLWRRNMPEVVLAARAVDARGDDLGSLDVFAHRSADRHRLGLTIVNRRSGPVTLELDGLGTDAPSIRARTLTARDLSDRVWLLDGVELRLEGDGTLPDLDGVALGSSRLAVPPLSITFVAIDR